MAEELIRVSAAALEEAINTFENKKNAMANAYLRIYRTVHGLESTWKGDSSNRFEQRFEEMYKNLEVTEERMDHAISKLRTALETYEELEALLKGKADNLDAGNTNYF